MSVHDDNHLFARGEHGASARHSAAGYRLYDEACAERLRFIKALQRMGLRLGTSKSCSVCATVGTAHAATPKCSSSDDWPRSESRSNNSKLCEDNCSSSRIATRSVWTPPSKTGHAPSTHRKEVEHDSVPALWLHMWLQSLLLLRRSIDLKVTGTPPGRPSSPLSASAYAE